MTPVPSSTKPLRSKLLCLCGVRSTLDMGFAVGDIQQRSGTSVSQPVSLSYSLSLCLSPSLFLSHTLSASIHSLSFCLSLRCDQQKAMSRALHRMIHCKLITALVQWKAVAEAIAHKKALRVYTQLQQFYCSRFFCLWKTSAHRIAKQKQSLNRVIKLWTRSSLSVCFSKWASSAVQWKTFEARCRLKVPRCLVVPRCCSL